MKSRISLLLLLLITVKSVSAAEEILIASGEHDGYTRLVFTVPPSQSWSLSTANQSAELRFNSPSLAFDSSRVFKRITKTRLQATQSENSETFTVYKLLLGCDCDVTAFPYLKQYVVVDIVDPQPHDRQSFVLTPVVWATPTAPSYVIGPQAVNFPIQLDDLPASGFMITQTPDAPPAKMSVDENINSEERFASEGIQKAVDLAYSSLLRQVMVAADQGLLDLTNFTPKVEESLPSNDVEPPTKAQVPIPSNNQVTIQTVFDRDIGAVLRSVGVEERYCLPEESLDIATWADGEDFFRDISQVRKNIFKEFDEPDYAAIEQLIKTYLRYGFGAEARRYLIEYGSKINNEELLSDMAAIVDGHATRPQGPLSKAATCDGPVRLWAMVGFHPDVERPTGDLSSIIDTYTNLPLNIRRILGPRLASVFVDRGEIDTARLISNILKRAGGSINDDHKLVIGNLMQAEGHREEAASTYQTLTKSASQVAVDALINMASLGLEAGQPPPKHILSDLNVAIDMWRGTDKELSLRRLEALWTAQLISGAEAIGLLREAIDKEPEISDLLVQTALEILQDISTDEGGYAATIYSFRDHIPMDHTADNLRLGIAKNLRSEGLPDLAIEILLPLVERDNTAAKLVTSNAQLAASRPEKAVLILEKVVGDPANALRVEAYLSNGNFENALEELQKFETKTATIVQLHWLPEDWGNIVLINSTAAKIQTEYVENVTKHFATPSSLDGQPITLSLVQDVLQSSRSASDELRNDIFQ